MFKGTYSSPYLRPLEIGYYLYAILEAVDSENDVTTIHSMVTPAVRVILMTPLGQSDINDKFYSIGWINGSLFQIERNSD